MQTTQTAGIGGMEQLSFDSEAFPPSQRLNRYREINGNGATAIEAGPAFRVKLDRWRLDRLVLHNRYLNDVIHERSRPQALDDQINHFVIHIIASGAYQIDIGDGFFQIPEQNVVLIDMSKPMRSWGNDAHVITVSMARDLVAGALGGTDDVHGTVLSGETAGLFVDFALALVKRITGISIAMTGGTTRAMVSLLAAAMDGIGSTQARDQAEGTSIKLDRACRIIEQRLSDPQLAVDTVIAATGMSRATLYRLFQPHGGLKAYIQRRRLDRVRVALSRRSEERSVADIVQDCGFLSESHLSRQFLSAFGMRPGEYRDEFAATTRQTPDRRVDYWLDSLR